MRFNTKRTKRFVEECPVLSATYFKSSFMRRLPEAGDGFRLLGLPATVTRSQVTLGLDRGCLRVQLTLANGNYGKPRYMMICPNPECSRRCGKLYYTESNGKPSILCRICLNLAYRSQNQTALDRLIDKKWDLLKRVGSETDFLHDGKKPKGMHWKTFYTIQRDLEELEHVVLRGACAKFGLLSEIVRPHKTQ